MDKPKRKAAPEAEFGSAGFLRRYSLAIGVAVFYALVLGAMAVISHYNDDQQVLMRYPIIYPVRIYSQAILFLTGICSPLVILIMVVARLLRTQWRQTFRSLLEARLYLIAHLGTIVISLAMGAMLLSFVLNRDSFLPLVSEQYNDLVYRIVMIIDDTEYFERPAWHRTALLYRCDSLSVQCELAYYTSFTLPINKVLLEITDKHIRIKTDFEESTLASGK